MDYAIGEVVVFGLHGVCRITGKETDQKDHSESFVLQPIYDSRCKLFVPVASEVAVSKMKKIIGKEEATELIKGFSDAKNIWIVNENQRKDAYRELLKNGERTDLINLIHTLSWQEERQKSTGKNLHRLDEKYYKDAKKILYGEIAYVLGIAMEEVEGLIQG